MIDFTRKLQACFDYQPFGFNTLGVHGSWVYGSAFAAKLVGRPEAPEVSAVVGLGIYKESSHVTDLDQILKNTDLHDVVVLKTKHSDYCSARGVESTITTKIEIAYPFIDLARAMGVDNWKQSAAVFYGYKNDELVFVCAGKHMTQDCDIPRGVLKSQWTKEPQ